MMRVAELLSWATKLLRGAAVCVSLLLASAAPGAPALTDPSLVVESVITAGSLSLPISVQFLSTNDLLVCEQHTGQVRRVINGAVQSGSVLDLAVAGGGEQGLLSMIFDPDFASNSFVYVYFTRATADGGADLDNRVNRYTWNGSALTNETNLLVLPSTPGNNHNGGVLTFGPPSSAPADQKLFIIIGELNRNGQLQNYSSGAAPDDTGCVLRISRDGSTPSGAEAGPFFSVPGANTSLQRVYAYGIRNSFGLAFDPQTDVLWDTENGPSDYDEINRVESAFNSGWEYIMGPTSRNSLKGAPGLFQFGGLGTYSDPEFSWQSVVAPAAIHFLKGTGLGLAYQFDCFVGDNNNGNIYHFEMNTNRDGFVLAGGLTDQVLDPADSNSSILFGTGFSPAVDMDTGPDGNLYVVGLLAGQIYRIRSPLAANISNWYLY